MLDLDGTTVIAVTLLLTVIASLLVGLRTANSWGIVGKRDPNAVPGLLVGLHLDDLLVLAALVGCWASAGLMIWGAAKGAVGGHSTPAQIENWINVVTPQWVILAKIVWSTLWLQPLVLCLIRLAVIFFCRRIFFAHRSFRIASAIMAGIVVAFTVCFFFGQLFDCGTNFAANWGSLSYIAQHCPFGFMATVVYTILDAALDLAVLVLPLPWVFRLSMPLPRRLAVAGCFLLGGLAAVAAIARMMYFILVNVPTAAQNREWVLGYRPYDVVGIVSTEMFLTTTENALALIAVCLPVTRRYARSLRHALVSRWRLPDSSTAASLRGNGADIDTTSTGLMASSSTKSGSRAHWQPLDEDEREDVAGERQPAVEKKAASFLSILRRPSRPSRQHSARSRDTLSSFSELELGSLSCPTCGNN